MANANAKNDSGAVEKTIHIEVINLSNIESDTASNATFQNVTREIKELYGDADSINATCSAQDENTIVFNAVMNEIDLMFGDDLNVPSNIELNLNVKQFVADGSVHSNVELDINNITSVELVSQYSANACVLMHHTGFRYTFLTCLL